MPDIGFARKPRVIYFAYGSNMSSKRLLRRVRAAQVLGIGTLRSHRLAFQKVSDVDGSGKADIVTHDSEHVMGVLYRLDAEAKATLDRHEGLGTGYAEKQVTVIDGNGSIVTALVYIATITDPNLKPFTWYLQHVIEGAVEAGLPESYLQTLSQIETEEDPDTVRVRRELTIYL
jgi:cation transport regulator ChaC